MQKRRTAKRGLRRVVETGGDDLEIERRVFRDDAERDARRAGLQGSQFRVAVRDTFGADGERAAALEQRACAVERLAVARGVRAFVLLAIDGDGIERAHERADDGHAEERFFGKERDAARRVTENKDRIDERVRMV